MQTAEKDSGPIVIRRRVGPGDVPATAGKARLTASWDLRQRSRFRTHLDDGREVAVVLPRGGVLRQGDLLLAEDGLVVEVQAAAESLTRAATKDAGLFARACYHMGNRHVPLQVEDGRMIFKPDRVLTAMLESLGLELASLEGPFDPESGAYAGGHRHGSAHAAGDHDHANDHDHDHDDADDHDHDHPGVRAGVGSGPRIHRMADVHLDGDAGEEPRGGN